MANGQNVESTSERMVFKLLDAQVASITGPWVPVQRGMSNKNFFTSSLEEGAADATISIMLHAGFDKPTESDEGVTIANLNTAFISVLEKSPWHWMKAKKIAGTTPIPTTVTATLEKL